MNTTIIDIEELRTLCIRAMRKAGATAGEADIIFSDFLDAEARGKQQCGFVGFATVLDAFPADEKFEVHDFQETAIAIKGNGNAGQLVARYAIDMAMDYLEDYRICAIGLKNITRFNSAGTIAQYAAEQGAIAIVSQYGGESFTIPITGKQANLAINPIGIALPETDPLFVLDISLSQADMGYTNIARFLNRPIEASWGGIGEGQDTLFVDELTIGTPFNGHSGYDLSLVFQMLSGALLSGWQSQHVNDEQGATILLIHPTIFGHSSESFQRQIATILDQIVIDDPCMNDVTYPSQYPNAQYRSILETGKITLPMSVVKSIRQLALA